MISRLVPDDFGELNGKFNTLWLLFSLKHHSLSLLVLRQLNSRENPLRSSCRVTFWTVNQSRGAIAVVAEN